MLELKHLDKMASVRGALLEQVMSGEGEGGQLLRKVRERFDK